MNSSPSIQEQDATGPSPPRADVWVRAWVSFVGTFAAVGALSFFLWGEAAWLFDPSMEGPLGEFFALSEIGAQLRVPFGQVMIPVALLVLLLRQWVRAGLLGLIIVLCLGPAVLLHAEPIPKPKGDGQQLRVLSANVLWPNPRHELVFNAIDEQQPDVIGLVEVSDKWRIAALAHFSRSHPHSAAACDGKVWRETSWGQLLMSRYPILSTEVLWGGTGSVGRPVVEACVDTPGGPVTFQLAHPERPGRAWRLTSRVGQLDHLGRRPGPDKGGRIVMGDLNTTVSSPVMRRFLGQTGLRDSRAGFGRQPTWRHFPGQVPRPIAELLKPYWRPAVAIDHVLISENLVTLERDTFPVPGSDHLGILAVLGWR